MLQNGYLFANVGFDTDENEAPQSLVGQVTIFVSTVTPDLEPSYLRRPSFRPKDSSTEAQSRRLPSRQHE